MIALIDKTRRDSHLSMDTELDLIQIKLQILLKKKLEPIHQKPTNPGTINHNMD